MLAISTSAVAKVPTKVRLEAIGSICSQVVVVGMALVVRLGRVEAILLPEGAESLGHVVGRIVRTMGLVVFGLTNVAMPCELLMKHEWSVLWSLLSKSPKCV